MRANLICHVSVRVYRKEEIDNIIGDISILPSSDGPDIWRFRLTFAGLRECSDAAQKIHPALATGRRFADKDGMFLMLGGNLAINPSPLAHLL